MKYFLTVLVLLIVFTQKIFAAGSCDVNGVTVVFVNGMLAQSEAAIELDKKELELVYRNKSGDFDRDVLFTKAFNPSRWNGIGDLIQAIAQSGDRLEPYQGVLADNMLAQSKHIFYDAAAAYRQSQELKKYLASRSAPLHYDPDLVAMIAALRSQVTTDKIVLVGHSQGTFYANSLYHHLVSNGVPPESVAVFNIATPASYVAGSGGYFTATNDAVVNEARAYQETFYGYGALPGRAYVRLTAEQATEPRWSGHSLRGVYLDPTNIHTYDDVIIEGIHQAVTSRISGSPRADCVPAVPISGKVSSGITQTFIVTITVASNAYIQTGEIIVAVAEMIVQKAVNLATTLARTFVLIPSATQLAGSAIAVNTMPIQSTQTQPLSPVQMQNKRTYVVIPVPKVPAYIPNPASNAQVPAQSQVQTNSTATAANTSAPAQQNTNAQQNTSPQHNAPSQITSPQASAPLTPPTGISQLQPLAYGSGMGGGGEAPAQQEVPQSIEQKTVPDAAPKPPQEPPAPILPPTITLSTPVCLAYSPCMVFAGLVPFTIEASEGSSIDHDPRFTLEVPEGEVTLEVSATNAAGTTTSALTVLGVAQPLTIYPGCTMVTGDETGVLYDTPVGTVSFGITNTTGTLLSDLVFSSLYGTQTITLNPYETLFITYTSHNGLPFLENEVYNTTIALTHAGARIHEWPGESTCVLLHVMQ